MPSLRSAAPAGVALSQARRTGGERVDAWVDYPAVASLKETQRRCPSARADWIDAAKKSVATCTHLPLCGASRAAGESHRRRAVILRAAVSGRSCICCEIGADIARVKFDRVQTEIHVDPGWFNGG